MPNTEAVSIETQLVRSAEARRRRAAQEYEKLVMKDKMTPSEQADFELAARLVGRELPKNHLITSKSLAAVVARDQRLARERAEQSGDLASLQKNWNETQVALRELRVERERQLAELAQQFDRQEAPLRQAIDTTTRQIDQFLIVEAWHQALVTGVEEGQTYPAARDRERKRQQEIAPPTPPTEQTKARDAATRKASEVALQAERDAASLERGRRAREGAGRSVTAGAPRT